MGVNVVQPEGDVLGVCVLHFYNGKCHWVADGKMFPIHMRKFDNILHSANISLESSIRGLFGNIFSFNIKIGVYEKLPKNSNCSTKLTPSQQISHKPQFIRQLQGWGLIRGFHRIHRRQHATDDAGMSNAYYHN